MQQSRSNKFNNNFQIFNGSTEITGGNNLVNKFIFLEKSFEGKIIAGKNATNIFDFSKDNWKDFSQHNTVDIDYRSRQIKVKQTQIKINDDSSINHYIGQKNNPDRVFCTGNSADSKLNIIINTGGGLLRSKDVIENCNRVVVLPYTSVDSTVSDYAYFIKAGQYKGKNLCSEINARGEGLIIFPEIYLLNDCEKVTYYRNNNTLSMKMELAQNSQFTLNIKNYAQKSGNSYNVKLIDEMGNTIAPIIKESDLSTIPVDSFKLHTEYDRNDYSDIEDYYKKVLSKTRNYKVLSIVKDKVNGGSMIFGSIANDIINLDEGTTFCRGEEGKDIYFVGDSLGRKGVVIDNNSQDGELDTIYIPQVPKEFSVQGNYDLCLSYNGANIQVRNYFRGNSYRHLMVMDSKGEVFIPHMESKKLIPFFHSTQTHNLFSLPRDFNYDHAVFDARFEEIERYKNKNDLLLIRDSSDGNIPFNMVIKGFYSDKNRWERVNFLLYNQGNFSPYTDLRQGIDKIIGFKDKLKADYEKLIKEYVIGSGKSVDIEHNQSDELSSVVKDSKRAGIVILKNTTPDQVEVFSSNKDLVLHNKQSNQTVTMKNWDGCKISTLEFGSGLNPIKVGRLNRFSLADITEIKDLINQASESHKKRNVFTSEFVKDFRCSVSVDSFENAHLAHRCLGFSSIHEQINFVENLCNMEQIQKFKNGIPTNNQVLPFLDKLLRDLSLSGYNRDSINRCFESVLTLEPGVVKLLDDKVTKEEKWVLKLLISKLAREGEFDKVKYLLRGTASRSDTIVEREAMGWNILHYAVYNGSIVLMKEIFPFILGVDVIINAKDIINGYTPLMYAALLGEREIAKFLIEKGADVGVKDKNGKTALDLANESDKFETLGLLVRKTVEQGKLDLVKSFLKKTAEKVDVEDKDEWKTGWTLLHYAAYNSKLNIIQDIFNLPVEKRGNINFQDDRGYTPLHLSVYYNRSNVVSLFINQGADLEIQNNVGDAPLHVAARLGRLDVLKHLLIAGANISAKNKGSQTAREVADRSGQSIVRDFLKKEENEYLLLFDAVGKEDLDKMRELLDNGANVNARNDLDKVPYITPLHYAVREGKIKSAALLLDRGADIELRESYLWTPLHYAAYYDNAKLELAALLIEKGADIEAKTGIVWNIHERHYEVGSTPLDVANISGKQDVADLLREKKAQENSNWSPLHYAARRGNKQLAVFMIENGANIEAKDINSSTPLLYAVQSNRLDMVKFLVDKGANINARNNLSQAPLEPGGTFINQEIISFLREKENERSIRKRRHRYGDHSRYYGRLSRRLLAADLSNQPEVVVNGVSQDASEDLLQNNEIVYAKGKAASGASKSFLWINGLFSWAKGKGSLLMSGVVNSLWPASVTEETSSDFATQDNLNLIDYSRVDMNGTILLLDTFIRKITGQKYVSTADQPISLLEAQDYALNITEGFEKLVKQAAKDSKISIHRLDIDFMGMHKEITGKIMGGKFDEISGILNSYVEKACPGREAGCPGKLSLKKFDKFITEFNKRLDVVLNQPMQQILSRDSTLKASNVKEQQISLEPRSYLNGTSVQGHLTQDRGLRNQGRDLIP